MNKEDKSYIIGDWATHCSGSAYIMSHSDGIFMNAAAPLLGSGGSFQVVAAQSATILIGPGVFGLTKSGETGTDIGMIAGTTGTIVQAAGLPEVGSQIEMKADSITLSVGPPGVGASIKITATGITLQVAQNKLSLDAESISESVLGVTTRQANAQGHQLVAAESKAMVQVTGLTLQGPMITEKADATVSTNNAIASHSTSGARSDSVGVLTVS